MISGGVVTSGGKGGGGASLAFLGQRIALMIRMFAPVRNGCLSDPFRSLQRRYSAVLWNCFMAKPSTLKPSTASTSICGQTMDQPAPRRKTPRTMMR